MDDVTHDTRLHVEDEGTGNYLDGLEMRYSIRGEEDRLIAFAFSESNARRLAVCWNALQHIPTVELESGQLQNMVTLKRAAEAERDSLIRDAERYRWIRGGNRIGVKWCELYSGGQALDDAIDSTMKALPSVTAKARFDRAGGHEETDPIERLRFFCSQAMGGQDWLDVEQFFNDVIAERGYIEKRAKTAEKEWMSRADTEQKAERLVMARLQKDFSTVGLCGEELPWIEHFCEKRQELVRDSMTLDGWMILEILPAIAAVKAERDVLRNVCAEAYKLAGALDAPVEALDNLSAAMMGQPLPHATFLPVIATAASAPKAVRLTEAEIGQLDRQSRKGIENLMSTWPVPLARAIEVAVLRKNGIEA